MFQLIASMPKSNGQRISKYLMQSALEQKSIQSMFDSPCQPHGSSHPIAHGNTYFTFIRASSTILSISRIDCSIPYPRRTTFDSLSSILRSLQNGRNRLYSSAKWPSLLISILSSSFAEHSSEFANGSCCLRGYTDERRVDLIRRRSGEYSGELLRYLGGLYSLLAGYQRPQPVSRRFDMVVFLRWSTRREDEATLEEVDTPGFDQMSD